MYPFYVYIMFPSDILINDAVINDATNKKNILL